MRNEELQEETFCKFEVNLYVVDLIESIDKSKQTCDLLRYDVWILLVVFAYVTATLEFPERTARMFLIREQTASLAKPQLPLDRDRFRLFAMILHLRLTLLVHLRVLNSQHDHHYHRDDDQSGHHADHHAQHRH